MIEILDHLRTMPLGQAALWVTAGNFLVSFAALAFGHLLLALFRRRVISERPGPLLRSELLLALACVLANCFVTFAGVLLWRTGVLRFRDRTGFWILLDFAILFATMDGMMYLLHRVAHQRMFYAWLHRTHHQYKEPRPLTLFVMNPLETLAFGVLWIALISVYPPTWLGMSLYLAANLAFGMIGHLGVEPFPRVWNRLPVLKWISTSTFHSQHHRDPERNLGFYTTVWDRCFGTLSPRYPAEFEGIASPRPQ